MASFKIPKGKTYTFSIKVLEKNSYLAKDLSAMDVATSSFILVKSDTLTLVPGTIALTKIVDDKILPADPDTYLNGMISVTIPDTITSTLVFERGEKVDGYYLKPTYQGTLSVKFTDGTPEVVATISDICVVSLGE